MSTPTIALINLPGLARALTAAGIAVVGGTDNFAQDANAASANPAGAVLAADRLVPGLRPWLVAAGNTAHTVAILRTVPGDDVQAAGAIDIDTPVMLDDLLATLKLPMAGGDLGSQMVDTAGVVNLPAAEPEPVQDSPWATPPAADHVPPAEPAPGQGSPSQPHAAPEPVQDSPWPTPPAADHAPPARPEPGPAQFDAEPPWEPALADALAPEAPPAASAVPGPVPPRHLEPDQGSYAESAHHPWHDADITDDHVALEPEHRVPAQVANPWDQPEPPAQPPRLAPLPAAPPFAADEEVGPWREPARASDDLDEVYPAPHAQPVVHRVQDVEEPEIDLGTLGTTPRLGRAPTARQYDGRLVFTGAGKGGVGKSFAAQALADIASAAPASMSVCMVDMNRGQADQQRMLKINRELAPTIYDAAIGSSSFEDIILTPEQTTRLRPRLLDPLTFDVILGPTPRQADPSIVTPEAYYQAIKTACATHDLVIVDTQIVEATDTSALIDSVALPLLLDGAWFVGMTDTSNIGVNNLRDRLAVFRAEGVPPDRVLVQVNLVDEAFNVSGQQFVDGFAGKGTYQGFLRRSPIIHNALNRGDRLHLIPEVREAMSKILFQISGRDVFDPERAAPAPRRRWLRRR